jgi:hypothetical protein
VRPAIAAMRFCRLPEAEAPSAPRSEGKAGRLPASEPSRGLRRGLIYHKDLTRRPWWARAPQRS